MADRVETLCGWLSQREWGEGDHDTLFCDEQIVTQWAMDQISAGEFVRASTWTQSYCMSKEEAERRTREAKGNHWVSVRYWASDKKATPEEIQCRAVECLYGVAEVEWGAAYSEITGYLWTDDEFKVGGHDMNSELENFVGKYLVLELTIHDGPKPP